MEIISIGIVGVVVSLIQQFVKKTRWSTNAKKALVVFLSIVAAAVYVAIKDTAFWVTALGILASASTVYALFIKDMFPKE